MRTQLSEVLRSQASVVETSTRDEVLAAMDASTFDAAFVDIDRADQNGFNIAARLRRVASVRRIRLIAVTSVHQRTSDLAAFRDAGFDLRVAWPLKPEQVIAAVHSIRIPNLGPGR